jgi:carbon storage regulator
MLTMLILSRRVNETVVFPGLNITVRVVRIRGGSVRLGIEAPWGAAVLREELLGTTEGLTLAPSPAVAP